MKSTAWVIRCNMPPPVTTSHIRLDDQWVCQKCCCGCQGRTGSLAIDWHRFHSIHFYGHIGATVSAVTMQTYDLGNMVSIVQPATKPISIETTNKAHSSGFMITQFGANIKIPNDTHINLGQLQTRWPENFLRTYPAGRAANTLFIILLMENISFSLHSIWRIRLADWLRLQMVWIQNELIRKIRLNRWKWMNAFVLLVIGPRPCWTGFVAIETMAECVGTLLRMDDLIIRLNIIFIG